MVIHLLNCTEPKYFPLSLMQIIKNIQQEKSLKNNLGLKKLFGCELCSDAG
jgi:hypothetical protein